MRPPTHLFTCAAAALAVVAGPALTAHAAAPTAGSATARAAAVPRPGAVAASSAASVAGAPVTPSLTTFPIPSTAAAAATPSPGARAAAPATGRRVVASVRHDATRFDVAGVTFTGAAPAGLVVEVRTHDAAGWSAWTPLGLDDEDGPDPGSAEARRQRTGTEAVTAAHSDGIDVRVSTDGAPAPRGLAVTVVDAKTAAADAAIARTPTAADTGAASAGPSTGAAPAAPASMTSGPATSAAVTSAAVTSAAVTSPAVTSPDITSAAVATATATSTQRGVAQPPIITRAQWGADDRMMPCQPTALGGFKAAVVHHTVNTNTYSASEAASLVRGIYAFHTKSRGWCDIGYNFLVDRFGRIYEGRKGSIAGFTQGAQSGGFNDDTFGVSVVGDFTSVPFPSAVVSAITRTVAWQADRSSFNPSSSVVLTSGGSTRYAAGVRVTKPRVMGHRDLSLTDCPGGTAYPQVAGIRSAAASTWSAQQYRVGRGWYVPVTPRRVLDTRYGTGAPLGPLTDNRSLVLSVSGLPSTTTAVTLNVTATGATANTYLAAYPANLLRPMTSNVSVRPGQTVATQVTVGVSPDRTVRLYNAHGNVHLIADLAGYFRTGSGSGYVASTRPARVLDTRLGVGAAAQQVPAGGSVTFAVPGLPSGTTAVSVNLTAVNAAQYTWVTAYRAGTTRPKVSNLNVLDPRPVANLVTVPVDSHGRVTLYSTGPLDLIADVAGYYATGRGVPFVAVAPRRVADTRLGWGAPRSPLGAGQAITIGVPNAASPVIGANLAMTAVSTSTGYVSAYRTGQTPPPTSTLNTLPGAAVSNLASIATGSGGATNVYNRAGATSIMADLMGYYTN